MQKTNNTAGLHLLKNKKGQFHWRLVARNGRILAKSSEQYIAKQNAVKSIIAVAKHFEGNNHYLDHTDRSNEINLVVYNI